MNKKFSLCSIGTFALLVCLPTLHGHGDEPDKLNILMRKKLEHSQKILEGVTVNDFEKIQKGAEELIEVSKAAEWKVYKTPRYDLHSNEFRRVTQTLIDEAKAKNLDGAALAYVDLTLTCVKCHKYVREVRMTRLDSDAPRETARK